MNKSNRNNLLGMLIIEVIKTISHLMNSDLINHLHHLTTLLVSMIENTKRLKMNHKI